MSQPVKPFALKDAPALIERLLPVQKLSAEAYKEQMSNQGKTLNSLGSYWKGRKPLILNKACILGCLLPATDNPKRDLEIFEKLMGMDDESFVARWPRRPKPRELLATLSIACISDYFVSDPPMLLPQSAPVDWSRPELAGVKIRWRDEFLEREEWDKLNKGVAVSSFILNPSSLLARRQLVAGGKRIIAEFIVNGGARAPCCAPLGPAFDAGGDFLKIRQRHAVGHKARGPVMYRRLYS